MLATRRVRGGHAGVCGGDAGGPGATPHGTLAPGAACVAPPACWPRQPVCASMRCLYLYLYWCHSAPLAASACLRSHGRLGLLTTYCSQHFMLADMP